MKSILKITLTAGLFITPMTTFALDGVVVTDANLRSAPSTNSEIINVLRRGQIVEVVENLNTKNGYWFKLKVGYISSELVSIKKEKVKSIAKKAVKKDDVVVYEQPSKQSKKISTIKMSHLDLIDISEVQYVLGYEYPWYKTENGWINVAYIKSKVKVPKKSSVIKPKVKSVVPSVPVVAKVAPVVKPKPKPKFEEKQIIKEEVLEDTPVVTDEPKEEKIVEISDEYKYFAGVSFAFNTLSVNKSDITGSIVLNESPDDSATSYTLEVGGYFKNNYIVSFNYEMANLDDVKLSLYHFGVDYQFDHYLNPYAGFHLGMADLAWQIDPLVNSQTKDKKLSSLSYGIQGGIIYNLDKRLDIVGEVSYTSLDFTTKLRSTPAESKITHEDKTTLSVGLRYKF